MVDQLIKTLGREAALFEKFLGLLEDQQRMLVKNNVEGLKEVTAELHEKLSESWLLNDQREKLVEEIRVTNAIEGDLNVTRLLEIVEENQADKLIRLRELINNLNDKIATTRDQNAMLLNRSREYIHKTMEMLSRINGPKTGYAADGVIDMSSCNVALDRRA